MNNETHEWLQDCKNGKDLYSYIKPFHTRKVCLYRCTATYWAEEGFPSCFRELRCLRHKIHIGLFVTVGIADLTWLLTASLQVIGNVFAGERFQPDFQSIGTSPGTLEDSGKMDNFLYCLDLYQTKLVERAEYYRVYLLKCKKVNNEFSKTSGSILMNF